ncbi:MAG: alpha/beta hydrolase [Pseudomonadota bacterium]
MRDILIKAIQAILKIAGLVSPSLAGRFAFHLFCHPSGRAKESRCEAKVMARAHKGELSVNGKRVTTYQWGDGVRPVLMLHGWESRGSRFAGFVSKLENEGFSPITFDAPGHGESSGDTTTILEYQAICQELARCYGRFNAIIGHSFGVLGLFQGLRSGVEAGRVVAISGVCDFRYLLDEFCRQLKLPEQVRNNLGVRIEGLFHPIGGIWQRFSVTHSAEAIKVPVNVIHDEHDNIVDPEQARKIHAAYDGAELLTTCNLGHRRTLKDRAVIGYVVERIANDAAQTELADSRTA